MPDYFTVYILKYTIMKCLYRYELRYLLLKYQIHSINILSTGI